MRASTSVPLAVFLAGLLLATGCSDSGDAEGSEPPTTPASGSSAPAAQPGKLVKEGWFGAAALHARVEIKGVQRQGATSVLSYTVTSLDQAAKSVPFAIDLLDPVGRKLYKPTAQPTARQFAPNAPQQLTATYPALPQNVQKVTALTPGTAGEFTGVPVTGSGGAPANGGAAQGGNPAYLYDITEGEIKDVTSSGSDVTVNLRTDVLFAFDSAKLSGRSKQVLDEAAQEIKAKADPDKRPLTFNGHTDSKGADDYNLKLSRERAEAVMAEMEKRLGGAFKYSAHGKGEAEPIAKEGGKDDEKARARNRRVEIQYEVREVTEASDGSTTASADGRGDAAAPAPFSAADGEKVASRYARFGEQKRRIDVKPFYRDGAYIVAVFDIVNEGPGNTPANAAYPHRDYPGGFFTSMAIQVPGGTDTYRAVRVGKADPGKPAPYVASAGAAYRTAVNEPVRGFAYIPAPPGNVSTVTFVGGPFGNVNNVPVK
ncbi:OmpA family protein [Actinomadura algeriensis]|uniref:Outer membrane protein OmpA-like peptidoglycan-associated protein n=1 Tax=Actinomadura algeriensis TaxID=1679523 RepID=A0ABR9JN40_9ACTN|nr:OmpA family protein [Actinomadura algeriensis]MBE1531913.1 outer membrane protein OmpA-like peptidoglycan-associated protein [Actinomadura algeriensis]